MPLTQIRINRFRNLEDPVINLSSGINIFFGVNGSGKTSVLESIYYLLTSKSFRELKWEILANIHSAQGFLLFGHVQLDHSEYRIGIERLAKASCQIRINGETIRAASQLAKIMPVLSLDASSFELINGGPANRRRYIDWGVFHVEHDFSRLWSNYNYCLKQRNTLLRSGKMDDQLFAPWEAKLAEYAEEIDKSRERYLSQLEVILDDIIGQIEFGQSRSELKLCYSKGWDGKLTPDELLKESRERDRKIGFTQYGPHRADLKIRVGKYQAEQLLSRGQQKLLVCAMTIAQAVYVRRVLGKQVVVLLDDVTSELDDTAVKAVLKILTDLNVQIVVSTIEFEKACMMRESSLDSHAVKLFHVEHGSITEYRNTLA